jgi:hypothetical protein
LLSGVVIPPAASRPEDERQRRQRAGDVTEEPTMSRTARIVTTTGLALAISLLTGAPWAHAQEMEHGRTRPAARAITVNQVQTHEQAMQAAIANVRG